MKALLLVLLDRFPEESKRFSEVAPVKLASRCADPLSSFAGLLFINFFSPFLPQHKLSCYFSVHKKLVPLQKGHILAVSEILPC